MNDILPPGRLPRPNERPEVRLKGVRSVPDAKPTPKPQREPDPGQPLDLPAATVPQKLVMPRKKKRWGRIVLIVLGLLLVAMAAAGFWAWGWYQDSLQAKSDSTDSIRIKVDSGEAADSVATDLEQKGVIRSALAVQIYMKLNGKGNVKAGSYLFSPNQPAAEIVDWLHDGRVDTFKVTILPGQTLAEIKKILIKHDYKDVDIDAAFAKQYTHPLLAEKPVTASLEGYIYPETYFVTSDTTVEQLIITTFDEFQKKITEQDLRSKLAQHNLDLYKGITMASIIEKEVTNESDQRQVAQIFYDRLSLGMTLGSDVTYHYAASLLGVTPSPDLDSPYNTRKYAGLPPGPIANVYLSVLSAVANPAPGDYLFFVAGDDGATHFARTDQEHQQNVQRYCKKLCSTF